MLMIRKTREEDLPIILKIYENARLFMRQSGNPDQWGNSYPPEEMLREDIAKGQSYLCMDGEEPLAVFCYFVGEDDSYRRISNGAWLNEEPYGVLHRVASVHRHRGTASYCMSWCLEQHPNLRVDTHRDNLPMQHCLEANGFTCCGVIYLEDGSERLAYQKVGKKK